MYITIFVQLIYCRNENEVFFIILNICNCILHRVINVQNIFSFYFYIPTVRILSHCVTWTRYNTIFLIPMLLTLISKHNRLALLLFYSSSLREPSNCVVHKIFNVNSCIIHFSMRLCLLSSYCKFVRNDKLPSSTQYLFSSIKFP